MTNVLIVSSTTNPINANSSGTILPYSGGAKPQSTETTGGQLTWRNAGTWTNLYSRLTANTVTLTSTAFYRVAAANGNQTLSIGASTTGEFQDTTHSDVAAAGDKIDIKFTTGATGTSLTPGVNSMNFAPTTAGNTINKLGCGQNNNLTPVGATYYLAMGGFTSPETTEANVQFKCKLTGTLQNLIAVVAQNVVAASSLNTRIGGVNGNCTAAITANTTGIYEDTTHTDSVVSGNLINFSVVVGAGTTLSVHSAVDLLTTTGNTHYIANEGSAGGTIISTGTFSSVGAISTNATEANVQALTTVGSTASNMEVFAVSASGTNTVNFRIGAANGNQLLTITASGYFEDTTHSDALTTSSEINYKWTVGVSLKLGNIGFMAAYSGAAPVTVNSWYPSVNFTPAPIVPPYVFMGSLADEVLNLPLPFLPHLPDVAPKLPPPPPSSVAMNVQAISTSIGFLPRIADAPLLSPVDRPNFFSPVFPLNFRLPWLPARGIDAPPITPADKPSYFAPLWLLNLTMPWQPRIADAAPRTPAAVPNFFSGIPAIISAVVSIPWFPRIADAPRLTPADKPNYFAPRWLLNLPVPWMQKISTDAPPVTPTDKPSIFSPVFALNFRLPWLPRVSDAPPVTPPDRPNFFSFPIALDFRLPWLPRIADAPKVMPPDRQSIFSFPLALKFRLPWLIRTADAPVVLKPDRQSIFMPTIKSAVLSWFPIISDASAVPHLEKQSIFSPPWRIVSPAAWFTRFVSADAPKLPIADKPNFFLGTLRFIPGSGVFGRIIDPLRQNRTVSPKMQSRTVDATHQNRTLNPDSDGRILDPRSQKRIL